ncbi:N-acetylneuraminate synthase family protein [Bdellovibrio bacteriovorus]
MFKEKKMKIIAESASNHQGSYEYLVALLYAAKNSGADYFTAQILQIDSFCDPTYEKRNLVEEIAFSFEQWKAFFKECEKVGLNFIPCAVDLESLKFCISEGFKLLKLHGTDLLNMPMLEVIAGSDVRILVETQLATERDIEVALSKIGKDKVECLLHGYSNYPTEEEELNLSALEFIKEKWGLPIGFADHSTDTTVIPMMAMAMGVSWLEKHITISRNDRRYDWQPSLSPEEFAVLVAQTKRFSRVFGRKIKHPTSVEVRMRNSMYKKYIGDGPEKKVVRADRGLDYYEQIYEKYPKDKIVTAVIARLKSTRLKSKALLDFHNDAMVFDLINYIGRSRSSSKTILATSYLDTDNELVLQAEKRGIAVYRGHPEIVVDRLLDIAEMEKAGGVFRVTGDMPFADPELMDKMAEIAINNDLDYVRALNFPLGMSAEYYKTSFLQKLYQNMEDPNDSEYLAWFVALYRGARKGCIDVQYEGVDLSLYSLTVDYQEDLDRCKKLLQAIGKRSMSDINLKDILKNLNLLDQVSPNMEIKLPGGSRMKYHEFVKMQRDQGFQFIEKYNAEV